MRITHLSFPFYNFKVLALLASNFTLLEKSAIALVLGGIGDMTVSLGDIAYVNPKYFST